MPVLHVDYFSAPLATQSRLIAILPEGPGPFPVVYQLHGRSDNHTAWQRWTTIELHAQRLGLAIVLPDGGRSFYCDTPGTTRLWEQHILATVAFVDRTFRTIPDRRSRGIGGLSMGGYGAVKIALAHPEVFASAVSHSGALDLAGWKDDEPAPDYADIWPGGRMPAHDDIRKLLAKTGRKPALYLDCGTDDFLLAYNRRVKDDLVRRGIPHIYLEHPGGHTWDYWQAHVGDGLDFHAGIFHRAARTPSKRTRR